MNHKKISLVINTLNAEEHIAGCIESCKWVDEIIVVDMKSSDRTLEIAARYKAKTFSIERAGYVEPARNFAISQASHEWCVLLDADERLKCSKEEILALISSAGTDDAAIEIKRINHIGKWTIQDSGWNNDYQVRILRKDRVNWQNQIHSRPKLLGNLKTAPSNSPVWIDHLNFSGVQQLTSKLTHYASKEPAPQETKDWNFLIRELKQEFENRYTPEVDGALSLFLAFQMVNYKLLIHALDWERTGQLPQIPKKSTDLVDLLCSKETSVRLTLEIITSDNLTLFKTTEIVPTAKNCEIPFDGFNLTSQNADYRIRITPSDTRSCITINGIDISFQEQCSLNKEINEIDTFFEDSRNTIKLDEKGSFIVEGISTTITSSLIQNCPAPEKITLRIRIDTDAWEVRFHQSTYDYRKQITAFSNEAEEYRSLQNVTNDYWEKDFRSRFLRPVNPLRKLTSRKYHFVDRHLPEPKLGIDQVKRIANEPSRVSFLKNALDLKLFDCAKYLLEFPEIAQRRINPFYHYLSEAWTKGFSPKSSPDICDYLDACFSCSKSPRRTSIAANLPREDEPTVSIIIVNFNGRHHLPDLLKSLHDQTYTNFEIIIVDNNSTDGSVEYISKNWPTVKLAKLKENVGFAEGNNIGQEIATGRLLCLLNNDTFTHSDWLQALVKEWRIDSTIGAVCSKVVFWKPFVELQFTTNCENAKISISEDSLRAFHPDYPKPIIRTEVRRTNSGWLPCGQPLIVYLPYEGAESAELCFRNQSSTKGSIQICLGDLKAQSISLEPGDSSITLPLPKSKLKPRWVINNAGSTLDNTTLEASDRGIYEFDHGQYNQASGVNAICGCSVLVDPLAIGNQALFCKDFFAYFEDTDLSLKIRNTGFKLKYAPLSEVYHKHASSSKEDSAFFRYHVARNKHYLSMLHSKKAIWKPSVESAKRHLIHMQAYYSENECSYTEKEFGTQIPQLIEDLEKFEEKVLSSDAYQRTNHFRRIGIYNSYWNTAGGGEHHALMFAQYFSKYGIIELISETNFDLNAVSNQFGLSLVNCKKRITPHVSTELTKTYDVFINTTFCSTLISKAKTSYYILSFPHRIDPKEKHAKQFLDSYKFLANSAFTQKWTKTFWKKDANVVYPSIEIETEDVFEKEPFILNVGRFFVSGHNKKQLELAENFKQLKVQRKIPTSWTLVLAGKIQKGSENYANQIEREYKEFGVVLRTNLSHSQLIKHYQKASIYWHATGLGENPITAPDKFEHFGITTCEALSHKCIPIVHNSGGQPEIVTHAQNGFIFDTEAELQSITADLISKIESQDPIIKEMKKNARLRAENFSRGSFMKRLYEVHPYSPDQTLKFRQ